MGSTVSTLNPGRSASKTDLKQVDAQAAVTGTATIAMGNGLNKIIAESVQVTVANAATTITSQIASATSISGASVLVIVIDAQAAANVLGASAKNVNVRVLGN